jgi:competence protein ComEC
MRSLDVRFAAPVGAAWVLAAILVGVRPVPAVAPVGLGVAAVALVALAVAARGTARTTLATVALACAVCAAVATSVVLHAPSRNPAVLEGAGQRPVAVRVVTSQTLHPTRDRDRARPWSATAVSADGTPISVPVLVVGAAPEQRVDVGATLEMRARAVPTDPGDPRAFLLVVDGPVEVAAPPPAWQAWAAPLRAEFSRLAATLPGDGGDLLPGLATGDTSAVTVSLDEAMTLSSLTHLTAVSGSNCAVLVGLALLLGRALRLSRVARVGGALVLLAAFVVLVTPEPSVLRAATMAVVVLVAMVVGRPLRGVPTLAVAVLVLVLADPWCARSPGFALSVLATSGLLVIAPPLAEHLSRALPRGLALIIAVPAAAQLACQPVLSALDPSIAPYGILANLLAEPAVPFATVLGLVACALSPLAPALAHGAAVLAWLPAAWIAAVARFAAGLPGARVPWWDPPLGPVLLAIAAALVVLALLAPRRLSRAAAGALIVSALCAVAIVAGMRFAALAGRPAEWQIAMCDVGQGDATVLRSAGRVALVDTGRDPELIAACLDDLGIARLDLVVLTHFDLDHVGGASALRGRADEVLVGPTGEPADEALLDDLAASGARIRQVTRGDVGALGEWSWRVLWPSDAPVEPGNGASVTIALTRAGECVSGCLTAILLGDLGAEAQRRVAAAGPVPRVDVVKVSHHGSADQDPGFYERVSATVGLIGVGADNGYGHPTERALSLLADVGTRAWRTDRCGLILLSPAADGAVRTWTARPCGDGGAG